MGTYRRRRTQGVRHLCVGLSLLALGALAAGVAAGVAAAAGPPFPPPVDGQAVYDTADALSTATQQSAETTIDEIEGRTGAEIVVYTQLVEDGRSSADAEADARRLMDQWGVGRKGVDDGLVILFDLYRSDPCHGEVQLYGGPGYRATYLTNGERQAIFENDMLPLLRECNRDGALLVALSAIDQNATPQHAATLSFARQANAVLGLLVAPLALLLLVGWGAWEWLRYGRDPVYLDDPSIHIPAPPPGLTPAAGALVRDGRSTRRALTAATLDLAARGRIAFDATPEGLIVKHLEVGIRTAGVEPAAEPAAQMRRERADRRPLDAASQFLASKLAEIGGVRGYVSPDHLPEVGAHVSEFNKRLETHTVEQGWFRERPGQATTRWVARGIGVLVLGGVVIYLGGNVPSDGLVVVGVALLVAGGALLALSASMPARTMPGAMIRAMLEAYRRTLEKTMAGARSMGDVVDEAAIPLLETPDDAVVWGVALGLQGEVEQVLERTADDLRAGRATGGYLPVWYGGGSGSGGAGGSSGGGGWAPGLMSSSAIPNFGGMMAALGTIGNSPSSGGGGGFGGGGSGGGGGGAGGGF